MSSLTVESTDWELAACRGKPLTIFYPVSTVGVHVNSQRYDEAKAICDTCSITRQCLEIALVHESTDDMWGIFGGKTPAERHSIRVWG